MTLLLVTACASTPRAGTGDLAFRLLWDGRSDLDLYVVDPEGDCIFFGVRDSISGGILDVDCNASSQAQCARPIENVFWPVTAAPAGSYVFWVRVLFMVPTEVPLAFELQLLRGERVVWRQRSVAVERDQIEGPFALSYPEVVGPIRLAAADLPSCFSRRVD